MNGLLTLQLYRMLLKIQTLKKLLPHTRKQDKAWAWIAWIRISIANSFYHHCLISEHLIGVITSYTVFRKDKMVFIFATYCCVRLPEEAIQVFILAHIVESIPSYQGRSDSRIVSQHCIFSQKTETCRCSQPVNLPFSPFIYLPSSSPPFFQSEYTSFH